jgi:hypothetical protein
LQCTATVRAYLSDDSTAVPLKPMLVLWVATALAIGGLWL